ncbi:hypothetical protein GCM10023340_45050 [Nocardioides marinquilinus]|uniref:Septum formation-related domain-containing protein n=1 Tax=Nocardioides marinquilinus TaxID=1210400 RepID=A0ABP9Q721_9ACTN
MRRRRGPALLAVLPLLALLGGCGLFDGDDDTEAEDVSVFDIEPGQCFLAEEDVEAELSDLKRVDCDQPHDQEYYVAVDYVPADPEADADVFPGDEALTTFAQGACAREFKPYVGIDYLDAPDLFFTFLLPSPRSWQEGDRSVDCFIIGNGQTLEGSAKDSGGDLSDGSGDQ